MRMNQKIHHKNTSVKLISLALIVCLTAPIAGCGKRTRFEAPELLDPVVESQAYRPVERMDVGDVEQYTGFVVPEETCYFYHSNATIQKIYVHVGEQVKAGDVLATIDTKPAKDRISEIAGEKKLENQLFEQDEKIYAASKKSLEIGIRQGEILEDWDEVAKQKKDLSLLEEDHRYDVMFHEFKIKQFDKDTAKQQKLLDESQLIAKKDGYVTFIKDLSQTNFTNNSENVVVTANDSQRYIEVKDITEAPNDPVNTKQFDSAYTMIDDERFELDPYPYTKEEMVVADNRNMYPYRRYRLAEQYMPPVGKQVMIYLGKGVIRNTIAVGKDSMFHDENGQFVYVKDGEGQSIRYIEAGKTDEHMVEVKSGLEEGELVFYSSDSLLPNKYFAYSLKPELYNPKMTTKIYNALNPVLDSVHSEYEGVVEEVLVSDKQSVSKNDIICTIKTDNGRAQLKQLDNSLIDLKQNYDMFLEKMDKQKKDLILEKNKMEDKLNRTVTSGFLTMHVTGDAELPPMTVSGNDPSMGEGVAEEELALQCGIEQMDQAILQIDATVQKETLNYEFRKGNIQKQYKEIKDNNNGNGLMYVRAGDDGLVTNIKVEEKRTIKYGDNICEVVRKDPSVLLVHAGEKLNLNQRITFKNDKREETYTGTIVGNCGNEKVYVTPSESNIYFTTSMSSSKGGYIYCVKMDDPAFFSVQDPCTAEYEVNVMDGMITFPIGAVKDEMYEGKTYKYVWRLVGDNLVKQYVTLANEKGPWEITCATKGLSKDDVIVMESEWYGKHDQLYQTKN